MFKLSGNQSVYFEKLSKVLAEQITGSTITRYFQIIGLSDDLGPNETKYRRIYNSFCECINVYKKYDKVIAFIELVYNPVNYVNDLNEYNNKLENLNNVLHFAGCEMSKNGKIISVEKATTIDEALQRSNKLKYELEGRRIHPCVMKYCAKEYLSENYFHACFEAVKGTFKRLADMVNLKEDGNTLLDKVFSKDKPLIVINEMKNQSQIDEFIGLKHLLLFLHKSIRNFSAHETRLGNDLILEKTLDIFTCLSTANKYLDTASPTPFVVL